MTPTQFTLGILEDVSMECVNEWKRRIIKKDTSKEARQAYVMALHEFVKSLEKVYDTLGLAFPDALRKATEI